MKRLDKRHFVAIGITAAFLLCGFIFRTAVLRFGESVRDVGLSVGYYFAEIFSLLTGGENTLRPGVTEVSAIVNIDTAFPLLWDDFTAKMSEFWHHLITADNFAGYLSHINQVVFIGLLVILLVLPFVVLFYFAAKWLLLSSNKRGAGADSKPLKAFRRIEKKIKPVVDHAKSFMAFIKSSRYIRLWLIVWLINLNILSIVMETAAYVIYLISSFDVSNVYLQVYKLSMDVALALNSLPLIAWLVIGYIVIDKLRRKIGLSRLRRYENRNKGFINSLNLVLMITGSMGSKKTTTLTDIILSQEAIFRDKAFELLRENDMKFPAFSWSVFEKELNRAIAYRQVYNLKTCRSWVRKKCQRFEKSPSPAKIFGYDVFVYPIHADGELKSEYIFDVLENYAQLYFIYTAQSSLIISNYAVRTDNKIVSDGHFPVWNTDFFERNGQDRRSSAYSHILDFDFLRLGKKVNKQSGGMFEFGVVGITEIGKERGNMVELQGVEKISDETNQKNDLFNYSLKMARHKATVDNYPFVRFYTDEQRASSWSADGKELCTLLNISEVSDEVLAMPFFFLEELLHDFVLGRFVDLYYDYRFKRSDNTLTLYILKRIVTAAHKKYVAVHEKYGYYRSVIETRAGTLDDEISRHKYYLCKKKIYADRFSTDCYSEILTAEKTAMGIKDIPTYRTTKPSVDEFKQQNSYFIRELFRIGKLADKSLDVSEDFARLLNRVKGDVDYEKIVSDAYKAYKKDIAKRTIAELDKKTQ